MADWDSVEGDGKSLNGIATIAGAGFEMSGWTDPEVVISPRPSSEGETITRAATLDTATRTFTYVLTTEDELASGHYAVVFRAKDSDGNLHTFPDASPKTLRITRALDW